MSQLLQRFRRSRRLVTALGVVTVLLLALLVWLLIQQTKTTRELTATQRQLAEARQSANLGNRTREQAEDLAAFLLNDLRSELVPLGRSDILGTSAERTLDYFESLPPALETAGTRSSRASILSTLANVSHANGDYEQANAYWDQVISLRKEDLGDHPDDIERILQLASDYTESSVPLRKSQEYKKAIAADKSALSLIDSLPSIENDDYRTDIEITRAMAFLSLGENERSAGNQEGAIAYYKSSRRSFENKVPNDTLALQAVMTSYNNTGICFMELEDNQNAEMAYLKALEPARRLVIKDPDNRHWQKEIATLLNNLGTIYDERGEPQKASPYFEEALSMRASLVSWDPANTRWQSNYANSLRNLGSLKLEQGSHEEAYDLILKSLRVMQTLLTREPDNHDWLRMLQRETRHFQEKFDEADETERALALNEEVRTFIEKTANSTPLDSVAWNQFLSKLYNDLSISEGTESEDAIAARLTSTTLRAENLQEEPDNLEVRYQLAASYFDLGNDFYREDRDPEALCCYQLSRHLFTEHTPPLLYDRESLIDFVLRRERRLAPGNSEVLTPSGALWSYYDSRSPPPADWNSADFDDSSWPKGEAELGYGDGDENTIIDYGEDSRRKNLAAWFRHTFTIEDEAILKESTPLRLSILCDDGAVLYLNGEEVLRVNMPDGELSSTTLASRTQAGRDEVIFRIFLIDSATLPLRPGRNVWAATVHQNEPASSDLSFDFEALANAPITDPLTEFDLIFAQNLLGDALPPQVVEWISDHRLKTATP